MVGDIITTGLPDAELLKAGFDRRNIVIGLFRDSAKAAKGKTVEPLCQFCALTGFEIGTLTRVKGDVKASDKCADCGATATAIAVQVEN